jgi:hypothetical protein
MLWQRVIRPVVAGAGVGEEIGADLQPGGLERLAKLGRRPILEPGGGELCCVLPDLADEDVSDGSAVNVELPG